VVCDKQLVNLSPVHQSQPEKSFSGEDSLQQLRETLTSQSQLQVQITLQPLQF
jgi:hypothetical protein